MSIEYTSKLAMDARSELEVFFLEQLRECKIEISKKKKDLKKQHLQKKS